jgi:hypothetical protein
VLAATGLSFLRSDAILLPVIGVALVVALWGFWRRRQIHRTSGPFMLGLIGSIALVGGVVFLHGLVAKVLIGVGTLALFAATIWNARLPEFCAVSVADHGAQPPV